MTAGDLSIAEKRVYDEKTGATEAYVASNIGVVRVSVSDDLVGEFDLRLRGRAADVTAGGGYVAAATEDGVALSADGQQFDPTGFGDAFGEAVAVGVHDGRVVAASADGRVARLVGADWNPLGTVEEPRAVDAGLVAAADGVYRVDGDDLAYAGLGDADVTDVAGRGVPLAATARGLYSLGNGWMDVQQGPYVAVDGDGDRAHAARGRGGSRDGDSDSDDEADGDSDDNAVLARASAGGEWAEEPVPTDESVVGFAYAPGQVVAVTTRGTVLATVGDGWRGQSLGVGDVGGITVR